MARTICPRAEWGACALGLSLLLSACGKDGSQPQQISSPTPVDSGVAAAVKPEIAEPNDPLLASLVKEADVIVTDELPPENYAAAIEWHRKRLDALQGALQNANKRKAAARASKSFEELDLALQDEENAQSLLAPYAVASMQVEVLKATSSTFRMTEEPPDDWQGEVCRSSGECTPVDPLIALFFLVLSSIEDILNDKEKRDRFMADVDYRLRYPLGGPNSDFKMIRNAIFPPGENNELNQLRTL